MLLGDLGADVVKVERPGSGDDTRSWGPPFVGTESTYFLGVNRNKRSMTLNLAGDEGRDLLRRLIASADVVVENFKPGQFEKWGLTTTWFERHAPSTVRCAITGYGTTGPMAPRPGYDFVLQAESGLMSITGDVDGEPMKVGVAVVDLTTGLLAAISILAALKTREETGRGQRVDVSLFDTSLMLLANVAAGYLGSGIDAQRYGNGHPNIVPYRSFHTIDGDIALAVGNDEQFKRLARITERPEWVDDARFATNQARVKHREETDAAVQEALLARSRDDWLPLLHNAGIPAGRVNDVREAFSSEHARAREAAARVFHKTLGEIFIPASPLRLSLTPVKPLKPPPLLGQHTEELLQELLGADAAAIAGLRGRNVV